MRYDLTQHEYGDSFTGMLCGAMVTMPDGSGDLCGLPSEHPIHTGWLQRAIRYAIGYAPIRVSITDHPEIRETFRTAEDADGLVERISEKLTESIKAIEERIRMLTSQQAIEWLQYVNPGEAVAMDNDLAILHGIIDGEMWHPPHANHITEAWPADAPGRSE